MNEVGRYLRGKVAVVTGASRGIGKAIAGELAAKGASVCLCSRDPETLQQTVQQFAAEGHFVTGVARDLRQLESANNVVEMTLQTFGAIDILVNNAGATKRGEFLELEDDDWADGFALKFFGAVRLTRAAWPQLKQQSGSLLNIIGVGGRTPGAQFTIGGSVNAALLSFTKAMADVGIRDGVQVNAINPGPVRTDRFQKTLSKQAAEQGVDQEAAATNLVKRANITRIGEAADIAALAAFILSPGGRLLQGALIDMDGGQTKTI